MGMKQINLNLTQLKQFFINRNHPDHGYVLSSNDEIAQEFGTDSSVESVVLNVDNDGNILPSNAKEVYGRFIVSVISEPSEDEKSVDLRTSPDTTVDHAPDDLTAAVMMLQAVLNEDS